MPCRQCDNGKWRWGSGPCTYDSKADCERANSGRVVLPEGMDFETVTISDRDDEWLESKLDAAGIKKVIPDEETLEAVYRRALEAAFIRESLDGGVLEEARRRDEEATLPPNLADRVSLDLEENRTLRWDRVIETIADEHTDEAENEAKP